MDSQAIKEMANLELSVNNIASALMERALDQGDDLEEAAEEAKGIISNLLQYGFGENREDADQVVEQAVEEAMPEQEHECQIVRNQYGYAARCVICGASDHD